MLVSLLNCAGEETEKRGYRTDGLGLQQCSLAWLSKFREPLWTKQQNEFDFMI
jgi:hypothetical protein